MTDVVAPVSDVLRRAGFIRESGRERTWTRPGARFVQVVTMVGDGDGLALVAGAWIEELEILLSGSRMLEQPLDLSRCQLRLPRHPLTGQAASDSAAALAVVGELDPVRALDDVASLLCSTRALTWPTSPDVLDLYLAGLAVLTGSPGVLWQAESVTARLAGTGWSEAANHVYAAVATAE